MESASRRQYFLRLVTVFVLYLSAGKLGLSVPFTSGNVSPVWPASGVALASVLLWGYEIWPGVALAAFFVNFLSQIPAISSIGIALGNTSSALLGGYLVRRFISDKPSFERLRDVLGLIAFGAAIAPHCRRFGWSDNSPFDTHCTRRAHMRFRNQSVRR